MVRGAFKVLIVFSSVVGISGECTSADCPAGRPLPASLLQLKVQRNQAEPASLLQLQVQMNQAELELADYEGVVTHSPQKLLQTVERLVEKMQASASGGSEGRDNGSGDGGDADSYFSTVRHAVQNAVYSRLLRKAAADQKILKDAYDKLTGCAHKYSVEEVKAGVGERRAEHDSCRSTEAADYVDKKEKCSQLNSYAESLGEIPPSDVDHAQYPTLAGRWRAYFARAAPSTETRRATFKELDDACTAAETKWSSQRSTCNDKQAAYETVVCSTVQHRQGGGIGDCLKQNADDYNATIQSVALGEEQNVADFVAVKRIECYVDAIETDKNFKQAMHDCHGLVVDTQQVRIEFYGWPPMPEDLDASTMYPCGKVWLVYAYGSLPRNAPHAQCAQCPSGSASTFIRWGSLSCPDKSDMVYKGLAGGAGASSSSSGANLLCLVENPTDAPDSTTGGSKNPATIHGVQYRDQTGVFNYGDVACSTCAFSGATYTMWGSTKCKAGHVELYTGNVMSSRYGPDFKSESICVDQERGTHAHSDAADDTDSNMLWFAEVRCGSIPCPPFTNVREVACAVCGIPDRSAAVYQRWGQDECTAGSSLIYSGVAAGSGVMETGGGYNAICLTLQPTDAPLREPVAGLRARLYGTEYTLNYIDRRSDNTDAACAVCEYTGKASYNVWGTTACGSGHVELYKGNVWAAHHQLNFRNEWVCVDPARKAHAKSQDAKQGGNLWAIAEYEFGPPLRGYKNNDMVACAVCGIPENFGAVFTRWGHLECPASSAKIYSGAAAGPHDRGGGANALCVSDVSSAAPEQGRHGYDQARIYGVSYGTMYVGKNHENWQAGCAVCAYEGLSSYVSWGSTKCQNGHATLYDGNVMASGGGYKFNYVCVDPDRAEHGLAYIRTPSPGELWLLAHYQCGSLPCGPYDQKKEAACAVCGIPGSNSGGKTTGCSGYDSKATCPVGPCMWVGHACQAACVEFRTNTSCPAQCQWDDDTALCQEPCSDFTTLDDCPLDRCWWRAGLCNSLVRPKS